MPIDNTTSLDLNCLSSTIAKAKADCLGTYHTEDGERIEISCEIPLGAASGPGCLTKIVGVPGPEQDVLIAEYFDPPVCCGPDYLQSWEQKHCAYLDIYEPTLTPQLELTNPPVLEATVAAGSGEDPPVSEATVAAGSAMVTVPNPAAAAPGPADISGVSPEQMKHLQDLLSTALGPSRNSVPDPAKPEACAPTDYKC